MEALIATTQCAEIYLCSLIHCPVLDALQLDTLDTTKGGRVPPTAGEGQEEVGVAIYTVTLWSTF